MFSTKEIKQDEMHGKRAVANEQSKRFEIKNQPTKEATLKKYLVTCYSCYDDGPLNLDDAYEMPPTLTMPANENRRLNVDDAYADEKRFEQTNNFRQLKRLAKYTTTTREIHNQRSLDAAHARDARPTVANAKTNTFFANDEIGVVPTQEPTRVALLSPPSPAPQPQQPRARQRDGSTQRHTPRRRHGSNNYCNILFG